MNKFFTNYKTLLFAKFWKDLFLSRQKKREAILAAQAQAQATQTVSTQESHVPVHELHVVFDRSYLDKEKSVDVVEVRKAKEEIRHIEYHHHTPQFAF